jgi:hypothetical protein
MADRDDGSGRQPETTVGREEFAAGWKRLMVSFDIPPSLDAERLQGRSEVIYEYFSQLAAGAWARTVRYYIAHAGDESWFPKPGQLFQACVDSYITPPSDVIDPEERARLRRETAEWAEALDASLREKK